MSNGIDSIEKDRDHPSIVVVTDLAGCRICYRMGEDGVLRPGHVWTCVNADYRVALFVPLPAGPPELLKVIPFRAEFSFGREPA